MMMAYQRGTALIPDRVSLAIWRSSVIQGLNSQSRVVWSLCSGLAAAGVVESSKSMHLRCLLIHGGWLQKVYLTFRIPVVGQAALPCVYSPVNSLSVYSAVKWKLSPFLRPLAPPCSCQLPLCLCLCPCGCSFCLPWSVTCSVCLWHWLLGHLNEISSWDLLCFFCKVNLFTASVNSAWSILNALCICLFFSNPLTWLLFFLLPSVL